MYQARTQARARQGGTVATSDRRDRQAKVRINTRAGHGRAARGQVAIATKPRYVRLMMQYVRLEATGGHGQRAWIETDPGYVGIRLCKCADAALGLLESLAP